MRYGQSQRCQGHQPQEPRRSAAAAAARRAEALETERAVFRMDTVVRLEPGVMLQNLTRANAAKVNVTPQVLIICSYG